MGRRVQWTRWYVRMFERNPKCSCALAQSPSNFLESFWRNRSVVQCSRVVDKKDNITSKAPVEHQCRRVWQTHWHRGRAGGESGLFQLRGCDKKQQPTHASREQIELKLVTGMIHTFVRATSVRKPTSLKPHSQQLS